MSKIVHFEIPVDDPQRAVAFYHDVLDWDITAFGQEQYWLVRGGEDEEPGANGALVGREELHRSPVLVAGVADLDDALARAQKRGGVVIQGKLPIPGVGWSAYISDSEGNTIGFFQSDEQAAGA